MRLSGQFQASLFFFYEKILSVQKASKRKITNFPPLWRFFGEKFLPLLFFVCLFMFLLVGFGLICVFVCSKSFRNNNNNNNNNKISRLEIVLITSYTILLTCTPLNLPMENVFVRSYFSLWSAGESLLFVKIFLNPWESLLIYDHLWKSIFLSLYENKQAYESHYLEQIVYCQSTIMIICWLCMFQFLCFLRWILFILCLITCLLNKVSLNSLNSVAIFAPFSVLDSLPSSESTDYILYSPLILSIAISFWLS